MVPNARLIHFSRFLFFFFFFFFFFFAFSYLHGCPKYLKYIKYLIPQKTQYLILEVLDTLFFFSRTFLLVFSLSSTFF